MKLKNLIGIIMGFLLVMSLPLTTFAKSNQNLMDGLVTQRSAADNYVKKMDLLLIDLKNHFPELNAAQPREEAEPEEWENYLMLLINRSADVANYLEEWLMSLKMLQIYSDETRVVHAKVLGNAYLLWGLLSKIAKVTIKNFDPNDPWQQSLRDDLCAFSGVILDPYGSFDTMNKDDCAISLYLQQLITKYELDR